MQDGYPSSGLICNAFLELSSWKGPSLVLGSHPSAREGSYRMTFEESRKLTRLTFSDELLQDAHRARCVFCFKQQMIF